jgi:hypothetical protein
MTDDLHPNADQRYLDLLDAMRRLHIDKAAGYGEPGQAWSNFHEAEKWGITALDGCLVRMGDKYRRPQNLRRNPDADRVGESFTDTLFDLAAYALIAIRLSEEEA